MRDFIALIKMTKDITGKMLGFLAVTIFLVSGIGPLFLYLITSGLMIYQDVNDDLLFDNLFFLLRFTHPLLFVGISLQFAAVFLFGNRSASFRNWSMLCSVVWILHLNFFYTALAVMILFPFFYQRAAK